MRLNCCPHCGGDIELGDSDIPFTPQQREIFNVLNYRIGNYVSVSDILSIIYQLTDEPESAESVLRKQIGLMRKHIRIDAKWGMGYRLPTNYRERNGNNTLVNRKRRKPA